MKVLDLLCPQDHVFEAWFGSENDFLSQLERGLLQCPLCGSKSLRKGLSAPRLNLGAKPPSQTPSHAAAAAHRAPTSAAASRACAVPAPDAADRAQRQAQQAAWLQWSRQMAANTEDVGQQFADQALRMHQGHEPERPIRGQATAEQALQLLQEGVPLLPLALPAAGDTTLQ